jgi:hypothetical protein
MSSTLGVILTVVSVLVFLLLTLIALLLRHAARVLGAWKQVSPATSPEQAPQRWESRLADLEADVVSLSSSFEKVTKAVTKQNARLGMRERRARADEPDAPPPGAPKEALYRHYGLAGKTSTQIAQRALDLVNNEHDREH